MSAASTFWKISIILTVVGSAYSGIQYYRNLAQARAAVPELKNQLALAQIELEQKKVDWEKAESLQARIAQSLAQKAPLLQKKEEGEKKFRAYEGEFKYLVKSMRTSVEEARVRAPGQVYPEIKLTDGRVLKDAKIRKVEERQISFMHADGIGSVPFEQLPDDLRTKFDMGNTGLAYELATIERNIFSPGGLQEFEGLTLRSAFVLKKQVSPSTVKTGGPILSTQFYQHKSQEIEINVASIQYSKDFILEIDGAIDGAIKGILQLEGISKPSHQVQDMTIEGAVAKRLSFSAGRFGDILHLEAVYVIRGQQMWFVQTVFAEKTKDSRPVANALLSSIGLK